MHVLTVLQTIVARASSLEFYYLLDLKKGTLLSCDGYELYFDLLKINILKTKLSGSAGVRPLCPIISLSLVI